MTTDVKDLHQQIITGLESGEPDALKKALEDVRAADLAEVIDLLDDEQRSRVIYATPPRVAAEVVIRLDEAVRGEVVEDLDDEILTDIVREMPPDDAADVVAELSLEQFDEILGHIPRVQSNQISKLLTYEQASAGGIMNPRVLALTPDSSVAEAVDRVRTFAIGEEIHYVYVVDQDRKLLGVVPLRRLVVNRPETTLGDICEDDPVTVHVDDDQEEVLQIIRKYDIAEVPVVDDDEILAGRVTYDDVMDVAEEEAAEDIYRMAGTDAAELETHSPFRAARIRMVWLIPCMIGTGAVAGVAAAFGQSSLTVAQMAALMMFVPMIAATSGNSGIQVSAIILRGFATGELVATRISMVFLREIPIAILVGVGCAAMTGLISGSALSVMKTAGARALASEGVLPAHMGLAAGLGMLCAIAESVGLGITLPFLFRRIGVDPAIASGPLITSLNDVLSASIYLAIALWILT